MYPGSFTHLYSVLIGDHVGVGDDQPVFRNNETRAAGDGHLPLRKYHPNGEIIQNDISHLQIIPFNTRTFKIIQNFKKMIFF